jgi:hypothetical protein
VFYEGRIPRCIICRQPVNVEQCKTDQLGRPVHENCYVSPLAIAEAAKEPCLRKQPAPRMDFDMSPLLRAVPNCWICGKPVRLENCKIDEHGQAVHEDCYAMRLKLEGTCAHTPEQPHKRRD